ncbi:MAG TPA: class I SAM-dependent methyltransferase [Cyclobacteriaceae bacterium]|jgi:hypothetical protein|nr:class I SAM-dependent methyltransferase [Cyclobacteriaceae bacterium]
MDLFKKIGNDEDPSSLSFQFRKRRFDQFIRVLNVTKADKIIDIGGYEQIWEGSGLEENVTLLNLSFQEKKPKFKYIECDACNISNVGNRSFDVAFSNSVIEHVGDFQRQQNFASEAIRISKRYWIQTPNKYFPIEPHMLFPFFEFLPKRAKKFVALNWKYSHFKRFNLDIDDELSRLRLITSEEMKSLFPGSSIYKEKVIGLTKSIVAYKS